MTITRPENSAFIKQVRETEHAPGHAILIDFFAAILTTDRFKNYAFLAAMIVAIGFNLLADWLGLPKWTEWVSLVIVLIVYYIIARRRERQDAAAFEAARDEWLAGERRPSAEFQDAIDRAWAEGVEQGRSTKPAPNAVDVTINHDGSLTAGEPYHDANPHISDELAAKLDDAARRGVI